MLSKVLSLSVNGIDGFTVQIEVDMAFGMPAFDIVGHISRWLNKKDGRLHLPPFV